MHQRLTSEQVVFSRVCWLYVSEALGVNLRTFSFMYLNFSSLCFFFNLLKPVVKLEEQFEFRFSDNTVVLISRCGLSALAQHL